MCQSQTGGHGRKVVFMRVIRRLVQALALVLDLVFELVLILAHPVCTPRSV